MNILPSTIINKYKVVKRLGKGSFGEVCMAVGPNKEQVAIKFEKQNAKHLQLRHEYKVYRELVGCYEGFCRIYFFGTQHDHNILVMDLLGSSLDTLLEKCNTMFTLKTVLRLADQIFDIIDTLHRRALIHRDIKPGNFAMGLDDKSQKVFCVDFGLSKRYANPKENFKHNDFNNYSSLAGTPRYASINNHLGISQSRRDDLESIAYMLIQFMKGSLPWQGLKAKDHKAKYKLILAKKREITIAQLCQGLPPPFAEFLSYARNLKFDATPDMVYIKKMFRDLYEAEGYHLDPNPLFDWEVPKDSAKSSAQISLKATNEAEERSESGSGNAQAEGDPAQYHSETPPPPLGVGQSSSDVPPVPPHLKGENNGNAGIAEVMPPPVPRVAAAPGNSVTPPPVPAPANDYSRLLCITDLKCFFGILYDKKFCEECKNKRSRSNRCPYVHPVRNERLPAVITRASVIQQLVNCKEADNVKDILTQYILNDTKLFA